MKCIFACLLGLTLLGATPAARAQFTFSTNNGALTVIFYTDPNGAVVIPSTAYGLPVVGIGDGAFRYGSALTSVAIPDSVAWIGDSAFFFCVGLTSVTIPNSVTNIGDYAFGSCSGLTNVTIGNNVTSIGNSAYRSCSGLASVTIPNSVTSIGNYAFMACSGLMAYSVGAMNPSYSSLDGVLFNNSQTTLIGFPEGRTASYAIPNTVTNIGTYAFCRCSSLTNVTIPNSVTSIENDAFCVCSGLTSVTIPNSVISIGAYAFVLCSGLTSVTVGNSVTSIRDYAFGSCSGMTSLTIPSSVTNIGDHAFYSCSGLASVFFQANAPSLGGSSVFQDAPAAIYYLPGTAGWGAAYGGRPAVLWNPAPQTTGPNFGVGPNGFGFNLTGTANIPIVVEGTASLGSGSWTPLLSCTLTNGLIYFSDPAWTNYPSRFYRIRSP